MTIVAEDYQYVVGVDTHARTHHYAIIDTRSGGVVEQRSFPTTSNGMLRAAEWIVRHTGEPTDGQLDQVLISMEGTRSYGTQAAELLHHAGYRVIDAPSPKRERGQGKNDQIDAIVAARGVLGHDTHRLADIRTGETSSILAILLTARTSMTTERTRAKNRLHALLRRHDLGIDARTKPTDATITTITGWRTRSTDTPVQAVARTEAIRLATRIQTLTLEERTNKKQLTAIVTATAPSLLQMPGVGPVNAAIVLNAWSHQGRIHSEAAFAKLGGTCPLEISSGNRHEHRLNRTGDRQLNKAAHSIVNERIKRDPRTQTYLAKRTAEGLSKKRIRRCLKRYVLRDLYRHLETLDNT